VILALFALGCDQENNGVAPQKSNPADSDRITEVDPTVKTAVTKAIDTESGQYDLRNDKPTAAQHGFPWFNTISEPTVITQPGFWFVTEDFMASGDAIVIESDWVYLYVGHHTITGPGDKEGRGIVVDGARHVAVVGGQLNTFGMGVVVNNSERVAVRHVDITGGDEYADPGAGIAPQIGIMLVNSSRCHVAGNKTELVNLGIFVRGGDSYRNRICRNWVTGGDLGLLGICYNPDGTGDPSGPHDDKVCFNSLKRFRIGIQANSGAEDNRFAFNLIHYFVMPVEDVDGTNTFHRNRTREIPMPTATLTLGFTGLTDLGPDYAYEGWLIVDGSPISSGVFTVDGGGMLSQTQFDVVSYDLAGAAKFVLTIEPVPDPDPAPASTHYLAGDFTNGNASLTVGDPAALNDDFTGAMGEYILNTPSTAMDNSDYANGIWWLDPSGPSASLTLPSLPPGWIYEGWVVGGGGPVTTGKFSSVTGADMDGGGPTAGPDAVPPFPGQDYITPPMPLIGYTAVISIEPYPDNSPAPFALKPLVDSNIEDVGIGTLQAMSNNAGTFPTGTAMR
jgi:hypothetical protein